MDDIDIPLEDCVSGYDMSSYCAARVRHHLISAGVVSDDGGAEDLVNLIRLFIRQDTKGE